MARRTPGAAARTGTPEHVWVRKCTSTEAAELLGVVPQTVKTWQEDGVLYGEKDPKGGKWAFDVTDEVIAARGRKPVAVVLEGASFVVKGLDVNTIVRQSMDAEVRARTAEGLLERVERFYLDALKQVRTA